MSPMMAILIAVGLVGGSVVFLIFEEIRMTRAANRKRDQKP